MLYSHVFHVIPRGNLGGFTDKLGQQDPVPSVHGNRLDSISRGVVEVPRSAKFLACADDAECVSAQASAAWETSQNGPATSVAVHSPIDASRHLQVLENARGLALEVSIS